MLEDSYFYSLPPAAITKAINYAVFTVNAAF